MNMLFKRLLLNITAALVMLASGEAKEISPSIIVEDGTATPVGSQIDVNVDGTELELTVDGKKWTVAVKSADFVFSTIAISVKNTGTLNGELKSRPILIGVGTGDDKKLDIPLLLSKSDSSKESADKLLADANIESPSTQRLFQLNQRARLLLEARLAEVGRSLRPVHAYDIKIGYIYLDTFEKLHARVAAQADEFMIVLTDFLLNQATNNHGLVSRSLGDNAELEKRIGRIRALPLATLTRIFQLLVESNEMGKDVKCAKFAKMQRLVDGLDRSDQGDGSEYEEKLTQNVRSAVTACIYKQVQSGNLQADEAKLTAKTQIKRNEEVIKAFKKLDPVQLRNRNTELIKILQKGLF